MKKILLIFGTRPEAVAAGTVKMVGTDVDKITSSITELLKDEAIYKQMSGAYNPYGDGKSSENIVVGLVSVKKGCY
jgi:UDP-N-acetylglucosamine 2-epimerase (non-hydrolysing)